MHPHDLRFALELADAADECTLRRFNATDLAVESKPDMTLVSDADRATEDRIRDLIAIHRPSDAILGEERGTSGESARTWIIDPIDGTHNYVRGVPVWATLIALVDDGEVVVGVVSAPALGRRWWAQKGSGAYASDPLSTRRPLAVSAVSNIEDASFSYSSLGGWGARRDGFESLLDRCWRTRGFGDFWSYMMVAEGSVDCAAEPELAVYDMAALVPIVTEAGGAFTSLDGEPGPWGPNALASNGVLHAEVLASLDVDSR